MSSNANKVLIKCYVVYFRLVRMHFGHDYKNGFQFVIFYTGESENVRPHVQARVIMNQFQILYRI